MFDLTGLNALVTGATGGLGGAMARALHAQGATVTLSGTRAAALEFILTQQCINYLAVFHRLLRPIFRKQTARTFKYNRSVLAL